MRAKTRFLANVPPELTELAEQVGNFIEYWGFKKVHGRIWTHLFLSENPLDAGDLVKRLNISKALVSMSVADLLEYEVIEPAGRGEEGTQLYRANPDLQKVIFNVLRQRERKMLSQTRSALSLLESQGKTAIQGSGIDLTRLQELSGLITGAQGVLDGFLFTEGMHSPQVSAQENAFQQRLLQLEKVLGTSTR